MATTETWEAPARQVRQATLVPPAKTERKDRPETTPKTERRDRTVHPEILALLVPLEPRATKVRTPSQAAPAALVQLVRPATQVVTVPTVHPARKENPAKLARMPNTANVQANPRRNPRNSKKPKLDNSNQRKRSGFEFSFPLGIMVAVVSKK
jgi:hypothetical protein